MQAPIKTSHRKPEWQQFTPPWIYAAIAFGVGLVTNILGLAKTAWQYISPVKESVPLYQKYLALQPRFFETDFDGALSHNPGDFAENSTAQQAATIREALDIRVNAYSVFKRQFPDKTLDAVPESDIVTRLFLHVEGRTRQQLGKIPESLDVKNGELICLELTLGKGPPVSHISIKGVRISTKGDLLAFDIMDLRYINEMQIGEGQITFVTPSGKETVDTSRVSVERNYFEKFRAPKETSALRVPLIATVRVSIDDAQEVEYVVGDALIPTEIILHYSDGRNESHEVTNLADMWSIDPRFPGLKSGE